MTRSLALTWMLALSWPLQACTQDFHLWLEIRPTPESEQRVRVEVDQVFGYAAHYRVECPGRPALEGQMTTCQGQQLQHRLDCAGVWDLRDGDEGGPESSVYYTQFDLCRGDAHQHSLWRGLPAAQAGVAQVLLEHSPMAEEIRAGLGWNQSQK